ncbi:MAG TPA: hypothetical protein VGD94_15565 [Vicinamibacterales bacterium]
MVYGQRRRVRTVDLIADFLTDDADKPGGLFETHDILKRAREVSQQRAKKNVPLERNGKHLNGGAV